MRGNRERERNLWDLGRGTISYICEFNDRYQEKGAPWEIVPLLFP